MIFFSKEKWEKLITDLSVTADESLLDELWKQTEVLKIRNKTSKEGLLQFSALSPVFNELLEISLQSLIWLKDIIITSNEKLDYKGKKLTKKWINNQTEQKANRIEELTIINCLNLSSLNPRETKSAIDTIDYLISKTEEIIRI